MVPSPQTPGTECRKKEELWPQNDHWSRQGQRCWKSGSLTSRSQPTPQFTRWLWGMRLALARLTSRRPPLNRGLKLSIIPVGNCAGAHALWDSTSGHSSQATGAPEPATRERPRRRRMRDVIEDNCPGLRPRGCHEKREGRGLSHTKRSTGATAAPGSTGKAAQETTRGNPSHAHSPGGSAHAWGEGNDGTWSPGTGSLLLGDAFLKFYRGNPRPTTYFPQRKSNNIPMKRDTLEEIKQMVKMLIADEARQEPAGTYTVVLGRVSPEVVTQLSFLC